MTSTHQEVVTDREFHVTLKLNKDELMKLRRLYGGMHYPAVRACVPSATDKEAEEFHALNNSVWDALNAVTYMYGGFGR